MPLGALDQEVNESIGPLCLTTNTRWIKAFGLGMVMGVKVPAPDMVKWFYWQKSIVPWHRLDTYRECTEIKECR